MDLTWKYSPSYFPSAPVIRLELAGMSVDCLVDTGFSGSLLIPFPLFESLGFLSKLSPDTYNAVMPDLRKFTIYTTKEEVVVGTFRMPTEVHSSPALNKRLVGRRLLRAFVAKMDGRSEVLSLHE